MDKCGELDRRPAAIDETGGDPEMQQIQQLLMRRRDLFTANAKAAMAARDKEAATEFVAARKQFDEVLAALAKLPPSPPPYREKMSVDNTPGVPFAKEQRFPEDLGDSEQLDEDGMESDSSDDFSLPLEYEEVIPMKWDDNIKTMRTMTAMEISEREETERVLDEKHRLWLQEKNRREQTQQRVDTATNNILDGLLRPHEYSPASRATPAAAAAQTRTTVGRSLPIGEEEKDEMELSESLECLENRPKARKPRKKVDRNQKGEPVAAANCETSSPTSRLFTGGNPLTGPGHAALAAKKVKKEEPEEEEAKNEQKERDHDNRSHRSRGNERGVIGGGGRVGDNSQHGSGDWRGQASGSGWGRAGRVNGASPQYPMNDGRVLTSAVNPRSNGGYGGGG